MKREDIVKDFFNKYAKSKALDLFIKLDHYCKENKDILTDKFLGKLQELFDLIAEKQNNGEKEAIGSIYLQVLRTGILYQEYTVLLSAYNEEGYFDKNPIQMKFTAGEFFTFLEYYQTYLLEQSKQYAGKVNADDIAVMVQKQALIYIKYIVKITRMAVKKLLHTDSFLNINKADIFSIHAGEYKDYEEQIYYCSNKKLNNEKVVKTINNVENGQFYFKPYCDLDLSKLVLKKSNYCFTDFSNSNLAETDMRASFFVDAKFNHCNMQFCHLKYAAVFDADFECANLKGADISYAFGGMTVPNETTEYILGFSGVNFSKANLEYTDFSNSDFSGADFRGAMFQQTDFTGAYLKNALFYQKDLCKTNMTEEQINTIIISQEG